MIGKLLSNNLINLGLYDEVKKELAEAGIAIAELEECEYEPSLGNGGLGRLAEALETWPREFLEQAVPFLLPIIDSLDKRVKKAYKDPTVWISDKDGNVHMAHMDIHFSHSTNGVAALHTEILKNSELKAFYDIYPEKFNNKTNGITFRRWLLSCNPGLAGLINEKIGKEWVKDAEKLKALEGFSGDETFLASLFAYINVIMLIDVPNTIIKRFWLAGHYHIQEFGKR